MLRTRNPRIVHVDPELGASSVVDVGGAGCDFVVENTVAGVVAEVDDATDFFRGGGWGRGMGGEGGGRGWREGIVEGETDGLWGNQGG